MHSTKVEFAADADSRRRRP